MFGSWTASTSYVENIGAIGITKVDLFNLEKKNKLGNKYFMWFLNENDLMICKFFFVIKHLLMLGFKHNINNLLQLLQESLSSKQLWFP